MHGGARHVTMRLAHTNTHTKSSLNKHTHTHTLQRCMVYSKSCTHTHTYSKEPAHGQTKPVLNYYGVSPDFLCENCKCPRLGESCSRITAPGPSAPNPLLHQSFHELHSLNSVEIDSRVHCLIFLVSSSPPRTVMIRGHQKYQDWPRAAQPVIAFWGHHRAQCATF